MAEGWDGGRTAGLGLGVDRVLIISRFLNTSVHSGRGQDEHTHLFQPSPGPLSRAEVGEEGSCSERDGDRKGGAQP